MIVFRIQPLSHLAHWITPVLDLSDRFAFELVCEFVCGHLVLLASQITKQGVYKSGSYSERGYQGIGGLIFASNCVGLECAGDGDAALGKHEGNLAPGGHSVTGVPMCGACATTEVNGLVYSPPDPKVGKGKQRMDRIRVALLCTLKNKKPPNNNARNTCAAGE